MPSGDIKNSIKPSYTKLELVSPGWTREVMHIPCRFLYSIPLFFLEVIVITGTGKPLIVLPSKFL